MNECSSTKTSELIFFKVYLKLIMQMHYKKQNHTEHILNEDSAHSELYNLNFKKIHDLTLF